MLFLVFDRPPSKRALHVSQHRAHRLGCDRGRAQLGLTEFSAVWAYDPCDGIFWGSGSDLQTPLLLSARLTVTRSF